MFDIGWTEMLMVAVVAIIVVGPKDLPGMLRTVGRSIKKVRGMAGDFQRQFDDALKEAELDGVKKSIDDVRSMNPLNQVKDSLNPLKDVAKDIENDISGDLDPGQGDDEDYTSFDPGKLFDESKLPKPATPVKVDVEAALAREKAKTAKKTKSAAKSKSSGKAAAKSGSGSKKATPATRSRATGSKANAATAKAGSKTARAATGSATPKRAATSARAKTAGSKPAGGKSGKAKSSKAESA